MCYMRFDDERAIELLRRESLSPCARQREIERDGGIGRGAKSVREFFAFPFLLLIVGCRGQRYTPPS